MKNTNNKQAFKLTGINEFSDLCKITENQKGKFLEGFQVDVEIKATNKKGIEKKFNLSYQNPERNDGLKAYCSFGITLSAHMGNDADESEKLIIFLEKTEEHDFLEKILSKCYKAAITYAEHEYLSLLTK